MIYFISGKTRSHHKRPTRELTFKERDLKKNFHRLLSAVYDTINKDIDIAKLKFHVQMLLTDEEDSSQLVIVEQYLKEVKEKETSSDILVFLNKYHFISYRNPQVLQIIVESLLFKNQDLVTQMNQYVKDCEEFELTLEELQQISHEEDLGPRAPSGLQEFSFKTDGDCSFPQWQTTYSETCQWSDHTLLKSVDPGSIIMTYVALPCVVSTIMKDLSDPVFLEKLKSKGVTVVQPELGQTHSKVSFSSIMYLSLIYHICWLLGAYSY